MSANGNIAQKISRTTEHDITTLTPVQQFYDGKSIFITGATGFVGKVLLEKLLRCCPGIEMVYLLMRPKRGKTADERLEQLLNSELYDRLGEEFPNFKKKISIIYGDLEKPGFGISDADLEELKNNVHIVFHSAARVVWNDPLRLAAAHHIQATNTLLEILHGFKKLEVFLYVSTSYVHRDPDLTVPEYVPKMNVSPRQFMEALEWLDDDALKAITPMLLREKTTSYLFMKALTENVVVDKRGKIPTAIVRPCNISPTYKDPIPGFCDSFQGMQGLMLAAAKGFLRTLYSFRGLKVNVIPVDIVVNSIITTAWHTAVYKQEDILVVNCVIDFNKLPLADEILLKEALKRRDMYPLANMYRYPDFTLYYSPFFYYIHAFIDHYIPALIGDTFLFIFTGKTLMIRLYRKIAFLFAVFVKTGREPWICLMNNYNMIVKHLSPKDQEIFYLDTNDLDWIKYMDDCFLGGRRYLAKEDPSNIPYARKKAKIWWAVTTTLKWFFICLFLYYMFTTFYDFSETPNPSKENLTFPNREPISFGSEL